MHVSMQNYTMDAKYTLKKKMISDIHPTGNDGWILSFVRDTKFRAGQVVAIDVQPDGEPRLYSIASGEQDEFIEILFVEKAGGRLTPRLSKMKAGDCIYVSEPFGNFATSFENEWWIAAGTGIAPFASMARSGHFSGKTLIQGSRYDADFYFSALFESKHPEKYFRCCSFQVDTAFYRGRLTAWLKENLVAEENVRYLICGSAEMVVEVRDILINKGIPFQKIISETYF